jgi:hypothetical protein
MKHVIKRKKKKKKKDKKINKIKHKIEKNNGIKYSSFILINIGKTQN